MRGESEAGEREHTLEEGDGTGSVGGERQDAADASDQLHLSRS